jgi:hypothetical protein
MNMSGGNFRIMDIEYREILRGLIIAMGGVAVVVALEVPWV